jgi:hypothetical protein
MIFRRPGVFGPGFFGFGGGGFMPVKLFSQVNLYDTPALTDINPVGAEDVQIDLAAIGGTVNVNFPAGAGNQQEGQCIGVCLLTASPGFIANYTGAVDTLVSTGLSLAGDCELFTWDDTASVWRLVAAFRQAPMYTWTWADAAERLAQTVSASDLFKLGYQTDIARGYQLNSLSGGQPNTWGELFDPTLGPVRRISLQNNAVVVSLGIASTTSFGTLATRTPTAASKSAALARCALNTAAGAGSIGVLRGTGGSLLLAGTNAGFRVSLTAVPGAVSASMRWAMGLVTTAPAANVDPGALTNVIAIGRGNAEANLQLYHNDGAGVATQIDLGADFPAATADDGYEIQIYSAAGASYVVQVRRLNGNYEASFTLDTNIPAATWLPNWFWYSSNNTDAAVVSLDPAELVLQQITR